MQTAAAATEGTRRALAAGRTVYIRAFICQTGTFGRAPCVASLAHRATLRAAARGRTAADSKAAASAASPRQPRRVSKAWLQAAACPAHVAVEALGMPERAAVRRHSNLIWSSTRTAVLLRLGWRTQLSSSGGRALHSAAQGAGRLGEASTYPSAATAHTCWEAQVALIGCNGRASTALVTLNVFKLEGYAT